MACGFGRKPKSAFNVSVLYSRKESEDKTVVVNLWFDVPHPTDSLLEAIEVCQGGNGDREIIPLNNCQWKNKYL